MNSIVEFGYNTDLGDFSYAVTNMGTKYNFNVGGEVLGIFSANDKNYLISQVTSSFGNNCMAGTVDAREIAFNPENNDVLFSNNEVSEESMAISRLLSMEEVKKELALGVKVEETAVFPRLAKMGLDLQRVNIDLPEKISVCGIEKEKFAKYKDMSFGRER